MSNTSLPLLVLPHPLILFPSSRISFPINSQLADALFALIDSADTPPVVAVVPVVTSPTHSLAHCATAARILRITRAPSRSHRQPSVITLHGLTRIRIPTPHPDLSDLLHTLTEHPVQYPSASENVPDHDVVVKFKEAALLLLDRMARDSPNSLKRDTYLKIANMMSDISDQRAPWMADILVSGIVDNFDDKLAILAEHSNTERLNLSTALFIKHTSISDVSKKIASAVSESLSRQPKEFFLSNGNHQSPNRPGTPNGDPSQPVSELDDDDAHEVSDLADLKAKIEAMVPGSEERKMGVREWRRLKRIPVGSVENGVIRSYLEWLTSLPWPSISQPGVPTRVYDRSFMANAHAQLDEDHFGLEKIKKRLIEYLAVVRLKELNAAREEQQEKEKQRALSKTDANGISNNKDSGDVRSMSVTTDMPRPKRAAKGPILLFVGPPGTGKTSLGQSIAKALGRPFQRISLGGVRDEAEIRGHRRTYVASGPGLIVQALRKAGRPDPVILLDEMDKVGQGNFHGDPGAALLEVLDPEQNHAFNDHYINVPVDLSQVLFICTSNTLDTISAPLLDRCEIIQLSGYTYDEKLHIAKRFLLHKQLLANGLQEGQVELMEPALVKIITGYTREAGVRGLERVIGAVVRWKAVEWAEHLDDVEAAEGTTKKYKSVVEVHELEKILGIARWDGDDMEREMRRGIVYGLVVTGQGEGGMLPVETIALPGSGKLTLTGSLGDVIRESGELALSWVKMHAYDLCITSTRFADPLKVPEGIDVHLHLPAGAQKKDGPSAGVAMVCALVSLLTGACVPPYVAMTGEITLRGRVTPVGGIKEKILGAHRAHISKVILPWANRKDVDHDVALEVRNEMQFVFVRTVREALDAAFGEDTLAWRSNELLLESRL